MPCEIDDTASQLMNSITDCNFISIPWLHVKQNYFETNFEIIVFYFACNHVWNWNKIILAAKEVLKLFQNYFSDNEHVGVHSAAAISLWNNVEIISGKFPRAEINLFWTRVDEGWNNCCDIVFHIVTTALGYA